MPRAVRNKILLLPCLWLLAMTLPHLDQGDFRRDTGRYAAMGLHMWTEGPFLYPYWNPETPYFNKPPLALWIHGAFLKCFGVHLTIARLPSIIAAVGVVCFSVMTVGMIGSRSEALASGLILALTYEFFRRTREISLDFWQLLFLMAAVWLLVAAAKSGRKAMLVATGVPLGLALLSKPLVALAMTPLLAMWLVWFGRRSWLGWLFAGAVPLALLVALPWHICMYVEFGLDFINRYFFYEVVSRAKGLVHQGKPFYFYGLNLLTTYWPWLPLVGFALYRRFLSGAPCHSKKPDLVILASAWCLYTLVLLSLFPDRKINYALPVYPMLSWIAAAGLCRLPLPSLRQWYQAGLPWLAPAAVTVLVIVSLLPIRFQKPPDQDWQALFAWLKSSGTAPSRLVHDDLDPDEICYFYLATGNWLPKKERVPPSTNSDHALLLTRIKAGSPSDNIPFLFRSGDLGIHAANRLMHEPPSP